MLWIAGPIQSINNLLSYILLGVAVVYFDG